MIEGIYKFLVCLICGFICVFSIQCHAQADKLDIYGRWVTSANDTIIDMHPCNGDSAQLCGDIKWLKDNKSSNGQAAKDSENINPSLRNRPLVGIEIVRGFKLSPNGVWSNGYLYNPNDGKTYTGTIRIQNGKLILQGCAMKILCKNETWLRAK